MRPCLHGSGRGGLFDKLVVQLGQGGESRIWDVSISELGEPRIADTGSSGNCLPVAFSGLQKSENYLVKIGAHSQYSSNVLLIMQATICYRCGANLDHACEAN